MSTLRSEALRRIFATSLRVLLVFVAYALLSMVIAQLGTPQAVRALFAAEMRDRALRALPLVAVSTAGVLSFVILRSRWSGRRLAIVLALCFYGVQTFLQQIEVLAFPVLASRLPPGTVPAALASGAALAACSVPLAVALLGKWRATPAEPGEESTRGPWTVREWSWKLALGVIWYEVVYFTFGYFIAWRTPGLPEFYGSHDPGSFLSQLGNVLSETPWLPLFEAARGALWVLIAVPLLRMHRGGGVEACLTLGLFFSLTVAVQLFLPNPFFPAAILRAHQLELLLSNFVFGALLAPLLKLRLPAATASQRREGSRALGH